MESVGSRAEVTFALLGNAPFRYEYDEYGSGVKVFTYEPSEEIDIKFLDQCNNDVGGFSISSIKFMNGTCTVINETCLSGEPARITVSVCGEELSAKDIPEQNADSDEIFEITQVFQPKENTFAFDLQSGSFGKSYKGTSPFYVEILDGNGSYVDGTYSFEIKFDENGNYTSPIFSNIPQDLKEGTIVFHNGAVGAAASSAKGFNFKV